MTLKHIASMCQISNTRDKRCYDMRAKTRHHNLNIQIKTDGKMELRFLSNTGLSFALIVFLCGAAMAEDAYEASDVDELSVNSDDQVLEILGTSDAVPAECGEPIGIYELPPNPIDQVLDTEETGDAVTVDYREPSDVDESSVNQVDQVLDTEEIGGAVPVDDFELNASVPHSFGVDKKNLHGLDHSTLTVQDSSVPTFSEKPTQLTCSDFLSQELDQAALKLLHCTN